MPVVVLEGIQPWRTNYTLAQVANAQINETRRQAQEYDRIINNLYGMALQAQMAGLDDYANKLWGAAQRVGTEKTAMLRSTFGLDPSGAFTGETDNDMLIGNLAKTAIGETQLKAIADWKKRTQGEAGSNYQKGNKGAELDKNQVQNNQVQGQANSQQGGNSPTQTGGSPTQGGGSGLNSLVGGLGSALKGLGGLAQNLPGLGLLNNPLLAGALGAINPLAKGLAGNLPINNLPNGILGNNLPGNSPNNILGGNNISNALGFTKPNALSQIGNLNNLPEPPNISQVQGANSVNSSSTGAGRDTQTIPGPYNPPVSSPSQYVNQWLGLDKLFRVI
jgi:hypothetical protein